LEELRKEFRDYQQSKETEQLQLMAKLNADADAAMKGATLQLVREKEQLTIEKDLIIDDLTHQLAELMKGSQLVQADNAEYQQKCSALQHEIDQHRRDHEDLSSQLKSSEDSLEELRKEFRDYQQSKETEQLQLVARWEERDYTVTVLEKEKLDALIALREREQAIVDLQSERAQLEDSTVSILADMAARVAESSAHSTALSEDLSVARQALEQALASSSEAAVLRAEIAGLQNSLTKAKLKIIDLLRSKTSPPSQQ
jgi:chromosome segregation ATPase